MSADAVADHAKFAGQASEILQKLNAAHVPMRDVFLPNFNARATSVGNLVSPFYTAAPAPMGLGYFGVQNVGGHNVGSISYTSSIEGSISLKSVNPEYIQSTSPDLFTVQLNTVLTHVTNHKNSTEQYWIQNVPIYTASTQTLQFLDNIWNFSSPTAGMQTSTLTSAGGTVVPGVFYFSFGPAFHMPMPFTVRLWNNASVVNDRPTVYFNYSITASNATVLSGSYDRAEFNSTGSAAPPRHRAPAPTFQINGVSLDPLGLLNDAEIMLGGPGGGSTTSIFGIDGSMGLWTQPNGTHTFVTVPAGSSYGTDTGETSEGIAEWTNGGSSPMAMLGPGPSLLQPLWGLVGAHSGSIKATFTIAPTNAFAFASPGSKFNSGSAAWAPVPPSGTAVYRLVPGIYTFKFLLSDHKEGVATVSANGTTAIHLAKDLSLGVYTPLWAWNNAQLASISDAGNGTVANPYHLDSRSVGPIDPLFEEFNDFFFPVFPGIFLRGTTAYVSTAGAPSFYVTYSLPVEASFAAFFGTPLSNNLAFQFVNAQHVNLVNVPIITGWAAFPFIPASVIFWNSSDSLIAGNTFSVQSTGLVMWGGTNNVVWGNTFNAATTTAASPGRVDNFQSQNGLQLFESGDLVYNNMFSVPVTAQTPSFNLYTGAPQFYSDLWNVTPAPASHVRFVNGFPLSGNILGLATQSGNFWQNYGTASDPFGVLPYNNGGAITFGGDRHPLEPFKIFKVVVTESGLPFGTSWSVTLNGITMTTNGTSLVFWDPNGTFAFTVAPVPGFTAHPSSGAITINGGSVTQKLRFT